MRRALTPSAPRWTMPPRTVAPRRVLARAAWICALALSLVAIAGCGGKSQPAATDTSGKPAPTATPFSKRPEPTIVTGAGAQSATEVAYTVVPGDTLSGLAERFDTTVDAILKRNRLTNAAQVQIGQRLVVPVGAGARATPTPAGTTPTPTPRAGGTATPTPAGGQQSYTVKPGDTAYDIAAQFKITVEELAAANGKTVSQLGSLRDGDTLTIPRAR